MTRFMMSLEEAVDLVLYAFMNANPGDIFVQKAPAVTMETLANAIKSLMNVNNHDEEIIGTRHGEKLYEVLMSREEMAFAQEMGNFFRLPPDLRDLNYGKFMEYGEVKISTSSDFNSMNTKQLKMEEMKQILLKIPYIQAAIKGVDTEPEE
jgi:UDP-glucose 4-epimerase